MAHITIGDQNLYVAYQPSVATTVFAVPFPFFSVADVRVRVNGVDLFASQYGVSGTAVVGGFQSGFVVLVTQVVDQLVEIWREVTPYRTTDITNGVLNIDALNTEFDRVVAAQQDLNAQIKGALRFPAGEIASAIPPEAQRAGRYLSFDAQGNPSIDLTPPTAPTVTIANPNYQKFTATNGQTVFDLDFTYVPGENQLLVYVDGILVDVTDDYVETDGDTITFNTAFDGGEEVVVIGGYTIGGATGGGGSGRYTVASYPDILCNSATDDTLAINAMIAEVADAGGGVIDMRHPTGSGYYINGTVRHGSNVTLEFAGAQTLIYGPKARFSIQGGLVETPATNKPKIASSVAAGATTLVLASGSQSDPGLFSVDDIIVIRGENDVAGDALYKDTVQITAIDAVTRTLTFSPAVENAYEPTYASSDYDPPGGGADTTTISIITMALLASNATEGSATVTVTDASFFTVGDYVTIEDDSRTGDLVGDSNNPMHIETNVVQATNVTLDTVTFEYPVAHPYVTTKAARVQKMLPIENAHIRNARVIFDEQQSSTNRYVFYTAFAVDCSVTDCVILGRPNEPSGVTPVTGDHLGFLGPRAHGVRIGEGSLRCASRRNVYYRPSDIGSGEGYGFTAYLGARQTVIEGNWAIGCRHSFLVFSGAVDTLITGNVSLACCGADFDVHGGREVRTVFTNNLVSSTTYPEASFNERSAFKIGNTYHPRGSFDTVVANNVVLGHSGFGVDIVPASERVMVRGNAFRNCMGGVRVTWNDRTDDAGYILLEVSDVVVADNLFDRCGTINSVVTMIGGDSGDPGPVVSKLRFIGNTIRSLDDAELAWQGLYVDDVSCVNNVIIDIPATRTQVLSSFDNCTGVKIVNEYVGEVDLVYYFIDSPESYVSGVWCETAGAQIVSDGGGNTNSRFEDYACPGRCLFAFDATPSTGLVFKPKHRTSASVALAAVSASTATIANGTTAPAITDGVEFGTLDWAGDNPFPTIRITADIGEVNTDTASNFVLALFVRPDAADSYTALRTTVTRIPTTGATSGTSVQLTAFWKPTIPIEGASIPRFALRGGMRDASTWNAGSRSGSTGVPILLAEEI